MSANDPRPSNIVKGSKAEEPARRRVIFALPWEPTAHGGVNEVVRNLMRLTRRDLFFAPELLIVEGSAATARIDRNGQEVVLRAGIVAPWNPARPLRHLLTLWARWPANLDRLRRLLHDLNPAAINVHYPGLWCLTLLLALRLACPAASFVISFHGSDLDEFERGSRITRLWWRLLVNRADSVTCCSNSLRSRLVAAFGGDMAHVTSIHNGIDPQFLQEELHRGTVPSDIVSCRYIVSVGTFEHKKGHDVLVRAFATIHRREPDLKLVIVGRTSPYLAVLTSLVAELGLGHAVIFKTDQLHPDTLAIMRGAELFVLSSRAEPFGIVLLEAAVLMVPLVATAVGGIPEVLEDQFSALLVPPDDAEALARAVLRIRDDEALRTKLVNNAQRRAAGTFTWTAAFGHYRSALLEHRPPLQRSPSTPT